MPNKQYYEETYKDIIKFYTEVKELVAAAEREDIQQRLSISAIAELRSALDHIMRSHSVEYGITSDDEIKNTTGLDPQEYCRKNYDKAYGHLYRAGYDAYDCISISMIDRIEYIFSSVSREALHTIIPGVTTSTINPYLGAKELFTSAKVRKDVESREQEQKQFETYEKAIKQLYNVRKTLNDHEENMISYDKEKKWSVIKQRIFVVIVAAIFCTLGVIIKTLL